MLYHAAYADILGPWEVIFVDKSQTKQMKWHKANASGVSMAVQVVY